MTKHHIFRYILPLYSILMGKHKEVSLLWFLQDHHWQEFWKHLNLQVYTIRLQF